VIPAQPSWVTSFLDRPNDHVFVRETETWKLAHLHASSATQP
jgi:hypothetical protein